MSGEYEGDIIRPLGLVTLYFGYAALEIDALLQTLSKAEYADERSLKWPVGQKISKVLEVVVGLKAEVLDELVRKLEEAKILCDRRNALVHGAIFGSTETVASRVTGRDQPVSPDALTSLANEIFSVKEHSIYNRQRLLEPMLKSIRQEEGA